MTRVADTARRAAVAGRAGAARRFGARRDTGQVALEFAGMMPLIMLLILAVWQAVLIGYGFSLAGNAADRAARAAAVEGDCEAAARRNVSWPVTAACPREGDIVKSTVTLKVPLLVPGFNILEIRGTGGAAWEGEAP
ncbi:TadE/TadG family type IV pilus assembly protein [Streptomyces sp. BI20]|uniref:TadE/TadG family type IV pilus assembly protein n=1 Tax=Streptomyces sp. BI20 TaxID=3403460 RepID=UPI003C7522AC